MQLFVSTNVENYCGKRNIRNSFHIFPIMEFKKQTETQTIIRKLRSYLFPATLKFLEGDIEKI